MLNDDNNYWVNCWQKNEIPFHRTTPNPLLEKHWPTLKISPQASVFVPLCGKSIDLHWLAQQGHYVIGVELSPLACEAFFTEHQIPFVHKKLSPFTVYESQQITLYCGDIFDLNKKMLSTVNAVYDRAALIALPESLRKKYADHLIDILPSNIHFLLLSHDSPNTVKGPPYAVSPHEIRELFGHPFQVKELEHSSEHEIPERLQKKGYREIHTHVYYLTDRIREYP